MKVAVNTEDGYECTGADAISLHPQADTVGRVLLFDAKTYELLHEVQVGNTSVIRVIWHLRVNQIFCSLGSGEIKV